MQTRALVKERSQRNLLLLIDGVKTEEMLLANVVGIKPEDFSCSDSSDGIFEGSSRILAARVPR